MYGKNSFNFENAHFSGKGCQSLHICYENSYRMLISYVKRYSMYIKHVRGTCVHAQLVDIIDISFVKIAHTQCNLQSLT